MCMTPSYYRYEPRQNERYWELWAVAVDGSRQLLLDRGLTATEALDAAARLNRPVEERFGGGR